MHKWIISVFLLFAMTSLTVVAQENDKPLSLTEVLQLLKTQKNLDISHDPEVIEGFYVEKVDLDADIESIFQSLSSQLPFAFEQVEDQYAVLTTKPVSIDVKVADQLSQEAIPGVYVKKNGQYAQKVSDPGGIISLSLEWQKSDTLSFEFLGYATMQIAVIDLLRSTEKTIFLTEGTTLLNEMVIESYLGNGISAIQRNHSLNIKTEDLGILPGDTNKDLLVSFRTLPGISTVTGRAGELRVRGGTPDQTLVLFDNIPIYHKGYYYGTISPFSTDIVDEVKVYRSGFTPRLGGRVGGAIEINSAREVPKEVNAGLGTSSVFGSGYLKLPVVSDKLGITLSARSSYNFNYTPPIEREFEEMVVVASVFDQMSEAPGVDLSPIEFEFRDINGNVIFQPSESQKIVFNFLSIDNDNLLTLTNNQMRFNQEVASILDNNGTNLSWKGQFGDWENEAFLTTSRYQYKINDEERSFRGSLRSRRSWNNVLTNTKLGNTLSYRPASRNAEFSVGYELTRLKSEYEQSTTHIMRNPGGPMNPGGTPMTTTTINNQEGTIHSVFGNYYQPDWHNFMFDLGFRANFYGDVDFSNIEPRLFVNYRINDQLTLKSSAGKYSQYLTRNIFFELGDLPIEKLIWELVVSREGVISSRQFLLGASYQAKNWIFDIDAYYKNVNGMTTNAGTLPNENNPRKIVGDLFSRGIDLLIRRSIGPFNIWTNYTLAQVQLDFPRQKTEYFPANYDQRHNFNITAAYQRGPLRASLGWLYASGIPDYTDDDFFPSTMGVDGELPPPTPVGDIPRFGAVHQLDASVAYVHQPNNNRFKFTVGLSVLNLYNRENILETQILTPDGPEAREIAFNRSTIGFAPDIMLRLEW